MEPFWSDHRDEVTCEALWSCIATLEGHAAVAEKGLCARKEIIPSSELCLMSCTGLGFFRFLDRPT